MGFRWHRKFLKSDGAFGLLGHILWEGTNSFHQPFKGFQEQRTVTNWWVRWSLPFREISPGGTLLLKTQSLLQWVQFSEEKTVGGGLGTGKWRPLGKLVWPEGATFGLCQKTSAVFSKGPEKLKQRAESCPGDFLPGEQWGSSPVGPLASGTSLKLWELNEEIHVQHLTASCAWNVLNKRELSSSGGSAKVGKVKLLHVWHTLEDQMSWVGGWLDECLWPADVFCLAQKIKKKSTFVVNNEKWGAFADKSWLSKNF